MPDPLRLEHCLLLIMWVSVLRVWWRLNKRRVTGWWKRVKDHLPMKRHPKSPKACPHCCRGVHLESVRINHAVTPWREVKSQRGRKKQYPTQGWACLNPACAYFGITEEAIGCRTRLDIPVGRARWRTLNYLTFPVPVSKWTQTY